MLMDIFVGALSFMVSIDKHNEPSFLKLKKNYLSRKDLLSDENISIKRKKKNTIFNSDRRAAMEEQT